MKILAIETSCDDTCVAVLESKAEKFFNSRKNYRERSDPFQILSNVVSSQVKLHAKYGGVYPFLAKREHQKNLPIVFKKALKKAKNQKFDLIAVTNGPGLEPCLWVGVNLAKDLANSLKLPIIPVNHIEAHIFANWPRPAGKMKNLFPAICLVVSGGHTQLILMRGFGNYKILGETRDDAAGECGGERGSCRRPGLLPPPPPLSPRGPGGGDGVGPRRGRLCHRHHRQGRRPPRGLRPGAAGRRPRDRGRARGRGAPARAPARRREEGRLRRERRHALEAALVAAVSAVVRRLPRPAVLALGRRLGWLWATIDRRHMAIAADNLRRAFPDWEEARVQATARGVYAHFATVLLDILWMEGRPVGDDTQPHIHRDRWREWYQSLRIPRCVPVIRPKEVSVHVPYEWNGVC